jgi:hypothetical protein
VATLRLQAIQEGPVLLPLAPGPCSYLSRSGEIPGCREKRLETRQRPAARAGTGSRESSAVSRYWNLSTCRANAHPQTLASTAGVAACRMRAASLSTPRARRSACKTARQSLRKPRLLLAFAGHPVAARAEPRSTLKGDPISHPGARLAMPVSGEHPPQPSQCTVSRRCNRSAAS